MTPQQQIALAHPCFLASETMHPRFARRLNATTSLILTINTGYE